MLPGTPLVLNLRNPSYCQTVYGGQDLQRIAARFSAIDHNLPDQLMKTWRQEDLSARIPRKLESLKDLPRKLAPFIAVAFTELPR